ncbi:hypothetical protein [Acetivibrio clariflavus]|uniref:Uncharacterized protein n=1 Tax=Acetivibrio clariflavus (strain DSM 19732 / NBRC 101661 / EBR45) TaxID=720554 RepID=G8LVQ3_ACECE|nr:hypothetical protein [Acetivibrio clariflavus]AEV69689.1 hypothetical protein Clocl_3167 [Acetivibrio clariflavus DSM 19732]
MKVGKHTIFMIKFITYFINGGIERYLFDIDYSGYVIEHFQYMENENSELAERFAYTVDQAYELGTSLGLSDEEFRMEISNAFNEWLSGKIPNLI